MLRVEVVTSWIGFGRPDVTPADLLAFAIEITLGIAVVFVVRAHLLHARRRRTRLA